MLSLGPLSFAAPWALAGLILLPGLWWLLRLVPPAPRLERFPPARLLARLQTREQESARTPLWLALLRLLLVALAIIALARPLLYAEQRLEGDGPLLVLLDNGWAAAAGWERRVQLLESLTARAERGRRAVMLMTTAPVPGEEAGAPSMLRAAEARQRLAGLAPRPWNTDRAATLLRLEAVDFGSTPTVAWLSDGLGREEGRDFAAALARLGPTRVYLPHPDDLPMALGRPEREGTALTIPGRRFAAAGERRVAVWALDGRGHAVADLALDFEDGATEGTARLDLPSELSNRVERLEVRPQTTAAGVLLLDERWRRRPAGIARAAGREAKPLLGEAWYLGKALAPLAEVRADTVDNLLQRPLSLMLLPDATPLDDAERRQLAAWVEDGGTLVRFAGPRLAQADPSPEADSLLPVRLRSGERTLGGALSWQGPGRLAPFGDETPFATLAVESDIAVRRQVLAEPSLDLGEKTWARLDDGSPLVTGARRGEGRLVLFHVPANADWSDLPLSPLFADMLLRLIDISHGVAAGEASGRLMPVATLDGFARLGDPPATARPFDAQSPPVPGPAHPPGLYGTTAQGGERVPAQALNLGPSLAPLKAIGSLPYAVESGGYGIAPEVDLRPWLLVAALVLFTIDLLVSMIMRGAWRGATLGLAVLALVPGTASAQDGNGVAFAMRATSQPRLAYVETGDPAIDRVSRAGLAGLSTMLRRRSSAELGAPMAVDPERHDLAFFPLLYWPLTQGAARPSPKAAAEVRAFLSQGGMILFDARQPPGAAAGPAAFAPIADALDLPPLEPIAEDHLITRTFYLISDYPGRWRGETVWVDAPETHINDGVSSVIAGSHDWAAAWALDEEQRPMYAVAPGGEQQREAAVRFGINLVMYALTGSYKADQVHMPAIIDRLQRWE